MELSFSGPVSARTNIHALRLDDKIQAELKVVPPSFLTAADSILTLRVVWAETRPEDFHERVSP
jgi:hypothetical protein